jgi:putative glycosyltransferase (TIGR04372 family)
MRGLFRRLRGSVRAAGFWLAVLVCRVLRIRFLVNPVYPPSLTHIGHLSAEPDCFVKEGLLGLRRWCIGVILIPRDRAANPCLLDYWRQRLWVVSSPFWVRLLAPLSEVPALRSHTDAYVTAMNDTATFGAIQTAFAGRPPVLRLTRRHREGGEAALQRLGVPQGVWFVGVHCREGGYDSNAVYHRARNVSVEAYFPAMRAIVERGGWCVRMGDPSMTPLPPMPGVIDYAHSPLRCDWMDVFLCAQARFMLGSASGLCVLAGVFGTPCAIANQSLPTISLPYGTADLFIPKLLRSVPSGECLTIPEMLRGPLGNARFTHCMELAQTTAENNSPEDIRDLALEVLSELEGTFQETEEDRQLQVACRSLMKPGDYTYGAVSRFGRVFLRKHRWLLEESRGVAKPEYLAPCCGTPECPCLREGPNWAMQQLALAPPPGASKDAA